MINKYSDMYWGRKGGIGSKTTYAKSALGEVDGSSPRSVVSAMYLQFTTSQKRFDMIFIWALIGDARVEIALNILGFLIGLYYAAIIKTRCPPALRGVGSTSRRPRLSPTERERWRAGP